MLPLPPESPRIRIPTHLGKYQITRVIGEGAMGTVYLALDPLLQRQVAVKAIRTQLLQDDADGISVAERFRIEAQAAGRLSHPGIVGVYEYGEEGGTAYIAMEYVRGHTLLQYLAHPEPLAEDDALSVAVQLLEALHHAHELGVWHRDIKPGNLIVTPDGSLKVTDFGIARFESATGFSRHQTLLLIGSPGYIAPERYTGELPDRRVDIFSCGAVIYQLLTGVPPFTGSASEVMYQVLHNEPAPPSVYGAGRTPLSASYDDVVLKALARHPQDRYATALEMRDALLSVARRPVSRRLQNRSMGRLPPLADGPSTPKSTPKPRLPASNVFEMPTQRIRRAVPGHEAARPVPPDASRQEAAKAQPTRQPPWTPEHLKAVEAALTERIGPIAKVMVARAQARCADMPDLLQCLASQALTAGEQQTFIAEARLRLARCGVSETRAAPVRPLPKAATLPAAPGRSRVPVLHDAATTATLHPRTVALAEALLTAKVGPIASLLVKQALAASTERTGFFLALAEPLRGCIDRDALLAVLQRLD